MPGLRHYAEELSRALDRFAILGANLRRGRFREYEAALVQAADDPENVDPRLINAAIAEAIDLSSISALPDASLVANLARVAHIPDGEAMYVDAGNDDPGRQMAFPFIVARQFAIAGAQISLENPSDVVVEIDGERILIECKRVRTQAALGRRLREAYRQMSEHRRDGLAGLGVIAVEISSILNPEFLELAVAEPEPLADGLQHEVEALFANAREHLQRAARNRRPDALVDVLLFRAQCFLRRPGEIRRTCGISWRAQPTAAIGSDRFVEMRNILGRMPAFVPTTGQAPVDDETAGGH